ncbi:MAG: hypothetical protein K0S51_1917 [Bacillales bacterium]|jgi:menaquinone-dependent protoporphyrinogen oxidase|nr:hypothetical protein [Bacillales bacterium]
MKTIIIYATKQGSSEEAAQFLKNKLNGEVSLVNLLKGKVPPIKEFDTVIIGGSIYAGKIQKKLSAYVKENLPKILTKHVGLFICAAHFDPEVIKKELVASFPEELFNHAIAKDAFGYKIQREKLNFIEKAIVKKIMGIAENTNKLSVERIEDFARKIQSETT